MSDASPKPPRFEIPDLELAPAVSQRTGGSGARALPKVREISLDGGDDDFELVPTAGNIGISLAEAPATLDQGSGVAFPSGRTKPSAQLPIDPAEVALLADYGQAPQNALLSPLYAYRVLSRREPLRRAMAVHQAELAQAELARDTRLMQLSTELRPQLEANEAFRRVLEPIREIERLAGERGAALSQASTGYQEQMARFDAELARLRTLEAKAQTISAKTAGAALATENELRRAEAKQQRVQIEIRGVLDLARQELGPAGGDLPDEQAAKLAELQAREQAFEPEVSRARSKHAAASAEQEQADTEVRLQQTQIRKLEREKHSAARDLEKQLSARAAGLSEAERQQRDALAEVGRAVLSTRGSIKLPATTLDALRADDEQVHTLAIRLETHARALDSHDRQRVKQGVIIVLSTLGVVLLSILLKAML